ncbi:MAG: carboxyltransferase domain-containing protein [Polyangiaceae bacterium]
MRPRPVLLNIDLGELPGEPDELYRLATMVNIACGGHAGDEASMTRAVARPRVRRASIAAHPVVPRPRGLWPETDLDRSPRSRRSHRIAMLRAESGPRAGEPGSMLRAVKLHGALYHDAARDPAIAEAVIDGVLGSSAPPQTPAFSGSAPARSRLGRVLTSSATPTCAKPSPIEGMHPDGSLIRAASPAPSSTPLPRAATPGAVSRAPAATPCVRSDTPGALDIARAVRAALPGRQPPCLPGRALKVLPYGEDGAYVDLEAGDAPDRAPRTHALAAALRAAFPDADVVTGAGVVAVFGAQASAVETTLTGLRVTSPDAYTSSPDAYTSPRNVYASSPEVYTSPLAPRSHVIDVTYDGPDLDDIAARTGLSRTAVIDLHTGREHVVELIGFLPGFAYMGPVDPRLVLPRRPAPRPRVEAGTVAVAGAFTGIYPLASPGGWNLLGASHGPRPFDPSRADPFLFSPGDRVRFRSIRALESVASPASPASPRPRSSLAVPTPPPRRSLLCTQTPRLMR